jgi:hypothetical protein
MSFNLKKSGLALSDKDSANFAMEQSTFFCGLHLAETVIAK